MASLLPLPPALPGRSPLPWLSPALEGALPLGLGPATVPGITLPLLPEAPPALELEPDELEEPELEELELEELELEELELELEELELDELGGAGAPGRLGVGRDGMGV
jgi:hypothetical protein